MRSRLEPMKAFARMVKTHLPGILAWTRLRISNGALEGMNNKVIAHAPPAFARPRPTSPPSTTAARTCRYDAILSGADPNFRRDEPGRLSGNSQGARRVGSDSSCCVTTSGRSAPHSRGLARPLATAWNRARLALKRDGEPRLEARRG